MIRGLMSEYKSTQIVGIIVGDRFKDLVLGVEMQKTAVRQSRAFKQSENVPSGKQSGTVSPFRVVHAETEDKVVLRNWRRTASESPCDARQPTTPLILSRDWIWIHEWRRPDSVLMEQVDDVSHRQTQSGWQLAEPNGSVLLTADTSTNSNTHFLSQRAIQKLS